jgi:predicted ATPase
MLKKVRFHNLRGFSEFEMNELGRVNLIVGTNNCGKTTVLEGIQILSAVGDVTPIWSILSRRGEVSWEEREDARYQNVDVRRLFHGHDLEIGNEFRITGFNDAEMTEFIAKITESKEQASTDQIQLFEDESPSEAEGLEIPRDLVLNWNGAHFNRELIFTVRRAGGTMLVPSSRKGSIGSKISRNYLFITAAALSADSVIGIFDQIVLTPEEDTVIEALKVIEPSIERIATSERTRVSPRKLGSRGGMVVRCSGVKDRIPIGSMGDGIWRMLGLALALVEAQDGILLIDEIDTGLHFSVMEDMWRLVYKTAKRLNVQVFASTHSRDCYESLAIICRESVSEGSDITIQRIDQGKKKSVAYTEQEIIAAAKRGMEVR